MKSKVRHFVFFSPLILLLIGLTLSLTVTDPFFARADAAKDWLLLRFDWLFSWSTFLFVVLMVVIYFSPLGNIKIGGTTAQPILSRWRWFAITLCTTIATGILFWGTAEPIYHLITPPLPGSEQPEALAMSTMFLHWTITPLLFVHRRSTILCLSVL